MSEKMHNYLALEEVMLALDARGGDDEYLADLVRDVMDTIWFRLEDAERAVLDARASLLDAPPLFEPTTPTPTQALVDAAVRARQIAWKGEKP